MIERHSLEQLRCLLLEVDAVGNIVDGVGGLDGIAGRAAEEFVGRHAFDFVAAVDHELLAQIFLPPPEGVPINRRGVPFELTLTGDDGQTESVDVLPTAYDVDGDRRWIVSLTPKRLRSPAHLLLDTVVGGGNLRTIAERLVHDWQGEVADDPDQAAIETFAVMNAGSPEADVVSTGAYPAVDAALADERTHATFLAHHRTGVVHSALTADLGEPLAGACADAGLQAAHIGAATASDGVTWWVVWLIDDAAFALKLLNADIPRLAALRVVDHALERDRIERGLRDAAVTDSLTGLRNRRHFIEQVETTSADVGDAVLFIDLDRFKAVNDTNGHHVGDSVLAEVGRRILDVCGPGRSAARIGGDEFAVLIRDAAADEVSTIRRHLIEAIGAPIRTPSGTVSIGATIGVAESTEACELVELVRRADLAMLERKRDRSPG